MKISQYVSVVCIQWLKALSSETFLQCTVELTGECFGNERYYS